MNTKRDEKIAKALRLCWHELTYLDVSAPMQREVGCPCGWSGGEWGKEEHLESNPDFSTFDGMGLILQKGPEREWWLQFMLYIKAFYLGHAHDLVKEGWKQGHYIHPSLLQDPDDLADNLKQFLDERGGEKR